MTCFCSAYTVDEKAVFRIVATATVFETFTYQNGLWIWAYLTSLCSTITISMEQISGKMAIFIDTGYVSGIDKHI